MPTVHLTLIDTPTGGVAVHSDFQPAVGKACSPAQAAALEIFNRTRRDWGMPQGEDAAFQSDTVAFWAERA